MASVRDLCIMTGFNNTGNSASLPSYTRVDVVIYYDASENLSLQLNPHNVADKLYPPKAQSTHQVTVGESINERLSIN